MTVLSGEHALEFRERMLAIQDRFAESPADAVAQAELVVTDAIHALNQVLLDEAINLGTWRPGESADREELETALGRYREWLDKVLSL